MGDTAGPSFGAVSFPAFEGIPGFRIETWDTRSFWDGRTWSARLFAQHLPVILPAVVVGRIAHGAEVALRAVASPVVGVVPVAFEKMREKKAVEIEAGFERKVLFAADAAVGHLLVPFCARKARDRREGTAVGTAHDELQVAVAYLGHGAVLLSVLILMEVAGKRGFRGVPTGRRGHWGWLTPGLPLRSVSGSPGAKFLLSLRDALWAAAVRRTMISRPTRFVNRKFENLDRGIRRE